MHDTMRKTLIFVAGGLILVVGILYVFILQPTNENEPFTIGVNIPLTGNLATIGEQIRNGMNMAIEEIQDSSFKVVFQDSKGNPKDGLSATNFLLEREDPDFVIVNLTSVAMASKPVLSQQNIQCIYLSTHPEITKSCMNCYRFFTSGKQEGDLIANEILKRGVKKIGLLYVNDAYGQGTMSYIKEVLIQKRPDIEFVDLQYSISGYDFKAILTNSKSSQIDNLLLIGYGFEYKNLFQKLAELNYSPNIFSNFSFSNREGKEIENYKGKIIFTSPTYDVVEKRSNSMKQFVAGYTNKYGSVPDFNAAYGYDNIKIIHAFYRSEQSTFRSFLRSFRYEGAMGRYEFLPDGDVKTQMEIVVKGH